MNQKFRKVHKIKKKKPIFRNRFFWMTILFLLFLGGIFYLLCFSSFFQVKKIKISGNDKVTTEDIQKIAEKEIEKKILFFPTNSIFLIKTLRINKDLLESFPQIAKTNLEKELPDTFIIEVSERVSVGAWCKENSCFAIDGTGVVFESVLPAEGLVISDKIVPEPVVFGQKVIEENLLKSILEIKEKLETNLKTGIEEFIIPSSERLIVKTKEGWEIYFDPRGDVNWQIVELGLILDKEIPLEKKSSLEYIDLRFSKVYYKYK